jgi:hypothetical protein
VISLEDTTDRLVDYLIRHNGKAADVAYREFEAQLPTAAPADRDAALAAVARRLETASLGDGSQAALIGAMLVEHGAPAAPLMRAIEPKVIDALLWAANFPHGWDLASYGADLPDPEDDDEVVAEDVLDRLKRNLKRAEMDPEEADSLTEAWFSVAAWMQALLVAAQPKDGWDAITSRDDLEAALAPIVADWSELFSTAAWLDGLFVILRDEPVIVLDRQTGRGYRVTIDGIGDNYQLHTLLADRLIGDPAAGLLDGVRPDPAWVAAATTGEELEPDGGIGAQFDLVDAYGDWIYNHGIPADIPELDGVRVIVLDPLHDPISWNAGRVYPALVPTVRLDEIMPAAESARWMALVQPVNL